MAEEFYQTAIYRDLHKHCAGKVAETLIRTAGLLEPASRGPFAVDVLSAVAGDVLSVAKDQFIKAGAPEMVEQIADKFVADVFTQAEIDPPHKRKSL